VRGAAGLGAGVVERSVGHVERVDAA
jgi:hypothetical protein